MASGRVFIVDDLSLIHAALGQMLALDGFSLAGTATSQTVALEQIAASKPDCVLVDLQLAVGNGMNLIQALRKFDPVWPRLLVFSGSGEGTLRRMSHALGADNYLHKPIERQLLVRAIMDVLADGFVRPDCGLRITEAELEVFRLLPRFETAARIAAYRGSDKKTVDTLLERLKGKLGCSLLDLKVAARFLAAETGRVESVGF